MKLILIFPVLIFLINGTIGFYMDGYDDNDNDHDIVMANIENSHVLNLKSNTKNQFLSSKGLRNKAKDIARKIWEKQKELEERQRREEQKRHRSPYSRSNKQVDDITADTRERDNKSRVEDEKDTDRESGRKMTKPKRRPRPYPKFNNPIDDITMEIRERDNKSGVEDQSEIEGGTKPKRRRRPHPKYNYSPYHQLSVDDTTDTEESARDLKALSDIAESERQTRKPKRRLPPYPKSYNSSPRHVRFDDIGEGNGESDTEGENEIKSGKSNRRLPSYPELDNILHHQSEGIKPRRRLPPHHKTNYLPLQGRVDDITLDSSPFEFEGEGENRKEIKKPRRRLPPHHKTNNSPSRRRVDDNTADSSPIEYDGEGENREEIKKPRRRLPPRSKHHPKRYGQDISTTYNKSFNKGAEAFSMSSHNHPLFEEEFD